MKNILKLSAAAIIFATSGLISGSANAQLDFNDWDVNADAGTIAPVVLGDNVSLDACGSFLYGGSQYEDQANFCGANPVTNVQNISVNWFARNQTTNAFTWLTGGLGSDPNLDLSTIPFTNTVGGSIANLTATVATGAGTFFSAAGTYAIGVHIAVINDTSFAEYVTSGIDGYQGNWTYNSRGDNLTSLSAAELQNGSANNGAATSALVISAPPVSVPEPSAALLLIPAIAMIARRQRRRKSGLEA